MPVSLEYRRKTFIDLSFSKAHGNNRSTIFVPPLILNGKGTPVDRNCHFFRNPRVGAAVAACVTAALMSVSGAARAQVWENLPQPAVPTNSILAQNAVPENPQAIPINPGTNGETQPTPEFPAQLKAGPEGNQEGYFFSLQELGKYTLTPREAENCLPIVATWILRLA